MEQLINLFQNNLILGSLFAGLIFCYVIFEIFYKDDNNKITPELAVNLINKSQVAIIDIRARSNFDSGHIVGSVSMAETTENNLQKFNKYKKKTILIVSNKGQSASKLCYKLVKQGIPSVKYIAGGIESWVGAGLPLTRGK